MKRPENLDAEERLRRELRDVAAPPPPADLLERLRADIPRELPRFAPPMIDETGTARAVSQDDADTKNATASDVALPDNVVHGPWYRQRSLWAAASVLLTLSLGLWMWRSTQQGQLDLEPAWSAPVVEESASQPEAESQPDEPAPSPTFAVNDDMAGQVNIGRQESGEGQEQTVQDEEQEVELLDSDFSFSDSRGDTLLEEGLQKGGEEGLEEGLERDSALEVEATVVKRPTEDRLTHERSATAIEPPSRAAARRSDAEPVPSTQMQRNELLVPLPQTQEEATVSSASDALDEAPADLPAPPRAPARFEQSQAAPSPSPRARDSAKANMDGVSRRLEELPAEAKRQVNPARSHLRISAALAAGQWPTAKQAVGWIDGIEAEVSAAEWATLEPILRDVATLLERGEGAASIEQIERLEDRLQGWRTQVEGPPEVGMVHVWLSRMKAILQP